MIVDSGASGTVVGEDMVKAVEAVNVKNDIFFKMAGGSRTPHMGRKRSRPIPIKDTFVI